MLLLYGVCRIIPVRALTLWLPKQQQELQDGEDHRDSKERDGERPEPVIACDEHVGKADDGARENAGQALDEDSTSALVPV